jgi:4-amino-4-deoxychorismate lyase
VKYKVHYNHENIFVEIREYQKRDIEELIIVEANELEYSHKFTDRTALNNLTEGLNANQDIIIEKNGYITDSSYSNLALWDGENWITPKKPLLKGTKRAYYLNEKMLIERQIHLRDLGSFSKISLINAMLDLAEVVVDIRQVSMA